MVLLTHAYRLDLPDAVQLCLEKAQVKIIQVISRSSNIDKAKEEFRMGSISGQESSVAVAAARMAVAEKLASGLQDAEMPTFYLFG